jgi:hypothetical protein
MKKRIITRRDFLRATAISPMAAAFASNIKLLGAQSSLSKAKVVLIRDENALVAFKKPDAKVVQRMLDEALSALLDEKDPLQAWKQVVKPSDIVGVKSNVMNYLPTTVEVEQVIKRRVLDAGVSEENIDIDDRGVRHKQIFQNATAILNVRPARTHHWSGIGGCIKNPIMFSPRPSDYHQDSCADLATLWDHFNLRKRVKLNILLMLNPQFHTVGPHSYANQYVWEYKGILVSQDPVAVDAVGLQIIQAKRLEYFGEDKPLQTPAKHIRLADTRHHLGVSDLNRIELIKVGWTDGIMI